MLQIEFASTPLQWRCFYLVLEFLKNVSNLLQKVAIGLCEESVDFFSRCVPKFRKIFMEEVAYRKLSLQFSINFEQSAVTDVTMLQNFLRQY